ncbi:hypothetical protein [Ancylobacter radicis]|uniref:Dodecin domain-containing protein n=1 Tax=Ancylobacter radicis TaxID=2836179 RepID=A0ABS5R3F7_9HYPH|nr:hypothetical protein [Ancylobacter radicis]MBS9476193.1 hypothetical protein [Ancylobacter radicis]
MATARVKLTLDVEVNDTWGPEHTLEQVTTQAAESAVCSIRKGIGFRFTLIGEPQVTCVIVDGKRPK